jgi:thiol-disulfide isomerase/thioredoxin
MTRRNLILSAAALMAAPLYAASGWREGDALPDLKQFGLSGTLPNLKGKVVYLDFWASWCGPCKASFPVLNGWHQELSSKGFVLLGVNVDEDDATMNAFLKKTAVSFPSVRDAAQSLVAAANVSTMPTSFIIDRKGIIRHVHNGFHKQDATSVLAQIQALL